MENEKLLPKDGVLYTLYEFIEECGKGLIFDDDGEAYYSDGRVYWSDQKALPSDIVAGKIKFSYKYRYIVWFKK